MSAGKDGITDTDRLDWLREHDKGVHPVTEMRRVAKTDGYRDERKEFYVGWMVGFSGPERADIRTAIDAAMNGEVK